MSGSLVSAQSFPGLVLLGIAVLASLNLFYRDRPAGQDLLHLAMSVIGHVMIVTGFVEACYVFLNLMFIPFFVIVCGVLTYVAFRYLLRRRMALLAVMAAASRRWMPLAPAVEAFSHEQRGMFRWRCVRLAELLNAGMPLGEALDAAATTSWLEELPLVGIVSRLVRRTIGGLSPPRALAMVEVGVRTGNISGGLAEAARSPASQVVMTRVWSALWYLSGLVLVGTGILTFLAIKIVPAFQKIFDDFASDLPSPTIALIYACNLFAEYGGPLLVLGLFCAICLAVLWACGVIAWLPPPLGMLIRRRETVAILRGLAVATEAGQPLELAILALVDYHPSPSVSGRLQRALEQMAAGQPWAQSLADQGLLRRGELALLASAERVGNLTWALRDAADGIERRMALRAQRWLEVLVPLLVLTAGMAVMFIIISLFLPLVKLIEKLV